MFNLSVVFAIFELQQSIPVKSGILRQKEGFEIHLVFEFNFYSETLIP